MHKMLRNRPFSPSMQWHWDRGGPISEPMRRTCSASGAQASLKVVRSASDWKSSLTSSTCTCVAATRMPTHRKGKAANPHAHAHIQGSVHLANAYCSEGRVLGPRARSCFECGAASRCSRPGERPPAHWPRHHRPQPTFSFKGWAGFSQGFGVVRGAPGFWQLGGNFGSLGSFGVGGSGFW